MERLLREILNVTPAHDAEKKYTERDVMAIKFNMIKHFLNFPLNILYIPYRDAPDEIKEEDLENAGLEKEEGYTPVDDFDPYH